jgi:hypothetical protein
MRPPAPAAEIRADPRTRVPRWREEMEIARAAVPASGERWLRGGRGGGGAGVGPVPVEVVVLDDAVLVDWDVVPELVVPLEVVELLPELDVLLLDDEVTACTTIVAVMNGCRSQWNV